MKKILLLILSFLFFINVVYLPVFAQERYVKVIENNVNIRNGPGTNFEKIGLSQKGDLYKIISDAKDKDGKTWYKIDFKGKTGYIAGWLVQIAIKEEQEKETWVIIIDNNVNLRNGPGTEFKKVGTANKNEEFKLLKIEKDKSGKDWYCIQYPKILNSKVYVASWLTKTKIISKTQPSLEDFKEREGIIKENANLRTGPSTKYTRKKVLKEGTNLKITGVAINSLKEKWYYINSGQDEGWVYAPLIFIKQGEVNFAPDLFSWYNMLVISSDSFYIKETPELNSNNIAFFDKSQSFTVEGIAQIFKEKDWLFLGNSSNKGWCRSDLFQLKKEQQAESKSIISSISISPSKEKTEVVIKSNKELFYKTFEKKENTPKLVFVFENTQIYSSFDPIISNSYHVNRILLEYDKEKKDNLIGTFELNNNISYEIFKTDNTLKVIFYSLNTSSPLNVFILNSLVSNSDSNLFINGETYIPLFSLANYFSVIINWDNIEKQASLDYLDKNIVFKDGSNKVFIKRDNFTWTENFVNSSLITNSLFYVPVSMVVKVFNLKATTILSNLYFEPVLISLSDIVKDVSSNNKNLLKIETSIPTFYEKILTKDEIIIKVIASVNDSFIPTINNYKSFKVSFKNRNFDEPSFLLIKIQNVENWMLKTEESSTPTLKIFVFEKALKGRLSGITLIIDPGHGNYSDSSYFDWGAVGPTGLKESEVVLKVALKLEKLLKDEGANVIMTRKTNNDITNPKLKDRAIIANSIPADAFISIHLNASSDNPNAKGTETYYWFDKSLELAKAIHSSIVPSLKTEDRGVKKRALYLVSNINTMPSVLLELMFISNKEEESMLKDDLFLDKIANSIFNGIVTYFVRK